MPSSRRIKVLLVGIIVALCLVINYFWSSTSLPRPNYLATMQKMHLHDLSLLAAHKSLTDSLSLAANQAKSNANRRVRITSHKGRFAKPPPMKVPVAAPVIEDGKPALPEQMEEHVRVAFSGAVVRKDAPPPRFEEGESGRMVVEMEGERERTGERHGELVEGEEDVVD